MRLRALIVDDEYPARQELRYLLKAFPQVEVVGEATNAAEALELIKALDYSILFLDIQMPGISGLDLARAIQNLERRPALIFTTAYEEYAVEAFEVDATDYLLKPFDEKRLATTLKRVKKAERLPPAQKAPSESPEHRPLERVPAIKGERTILLDVKDIIFAYAKDEKIFLRLFKETLQSPFTLADLEARLKRYPFLRAHRKYLVNLLKVKEVLPSFKGKVALVMDDSTHTEIPVSRARGKMLRQRLGMPK